MKRRFLSNLIIIFGITLLFMSVVSAGQFRTPDKDTSCGVTPTDSNCYNNYGVYVEASGSPGGGCSATYVGYIGWDLSSQSDTWQSAELKLYAYKTSGGGPSYTFTLYPASNDTWSETGTNPGYNSSINLGTATVDLSNASASNMILVDFTSNDLGTYFLNKKGHEATIAVVMTNGCGNVNGSVWFEDREGSGSTLLASGNRSKDGHDISVIESANEPDLIFWTGKGATAVSVSSLNAHSGPNWPLFAGIAVVALAIVAGVGYSVRRARQP